VSFKINLTQTTAIIFMNAMF